MSQLRYGDAIAQARPRVVAALAAQFRDLDIAEESFAAASEALLSYTADEVRNVPGWLYQAARRKALDGKRKAVREERAVEAAAMLASDSDILKMPDPIPDERLRLLFICCHPALAPESRVALALRIVCGVPVEMIARAFAVTPATMFQRITRAKAKVRNASIPFELPHRSLRPERVASVLGALEVGLLLSFGEDSGDSKDDLPADVLHLAQILVEILPQDAEARSFLALVYLVGSRLSSRLDRDGAMVPLSRQDTRRWSRWMIEQGRSQLDAAAELQSPGPYQLLAAIQLAHARRIDGGEVDWGAILKFYDALLTVRPGPITSINRALALAECEGAPAGLEALEGIDCERLANHRPLHVARAKLLENARQPQPAASELRKALKTDPARPERLFLESWLERLLPS